MPALGWLTELVDGDVVLRGVDVDPLDVRHALAVANHVRSDQSLVVRRRPGHQRRVRRCLRTHWRRLAGSLRLLWTNTKQTRNLSWCPWTGWTLSVTVHCHDDGTANIVMAITITNGLKCLFRDPKWRLGGVFTTIILLFIIETHKRRKRVLSPHWSLRIFRCDLQVVTRIQTRNLS